jgi:hypothetical protein
MNETKEEIDESIHDEMVRHAAAAAAAAAAATPRSTESAEVLN